MQFFTKRDCYIYISKDKDYKQVYSDKNRAIYEYVGENR